MLCNTNNIIIQYTLFTFKQNVNFYRCFFFSYVNADSIKLNNCLPLAHRPFCLRRYRCKFQIFFCNSRRCMKIEELLKGLTRKKAKSFGIKVRPYVAVFKRLSNAFYIFLTRTFLNRRCKNIDHRLVFVAPISI